MFEKLSGNYTAFNATSITVNETYAVNELKNRVCVIGAIHYIITSNDAHVLYFSNALALIGTYEVWYIDRNNLTTFESDMSDTVKIPDALINKKFDTTAAHFTQLIRNYFRNLYSAYSDVDPLTLIINLDVVQVPFVYYCMAEIYGDTLLIQSDINAYKEEKYRKKYAELIKDCLAMLAVDTDQNGELDNSDLAQSVGKGILLSR